MPARHKHPKVQGRTERRKRIFLHFALTNGFWFNPIVCSVDALAGTTIPRGAFHSLSYVEKYLKDSIETHDETPQPLVWTTSRSEALEKIARAGVVLATTATSSRL